MASITAAQVASGGIECTSTTNDRKSSCETDLILRPYLSLPKPTMYRRMFRLNMFFGGTVD